MYAEGDEVRIDIPDETDPDFDRLHGLEGTVVAVIKDDAGAETGDERDSVLFRVALAGREESVDMRWRDLRPA
ncbi:hypothetical protein ACERIT_08755 [Halopenitus sp. H-Gu1]|uniref:hypothetical protein n=1 Tax=Halopenitus sp. H-Gu1 TaxID=3242697 RepID=UPI00359E0DD4